MRSAIHWLVTHPTTIAIAAFCIFIFGLNSYVSLPRESSPDITIPVVIITTPYVGVSPEDVESLISIPMENELSSLKNVKEMRSTSAEGISIVVIEFEPDTVIEDALQRVRDRVGRVRPDLPADAEDPAIREISFSDVPVVLITMAGSVGEDALKEYAEKLQDDLTRISGVLEVDLTGGTERQITVEVVPERLSYYGFSLDDVTGAINNENVNIPGGNVEVGRGNFLLRVPGEFDVPQEIEQVAVKRVGDRPVFVRDLARVVDGYEPRETYSRLRGEASVTLAIKKRAGANILDVTEQAKALASEHAQTWPDTVTWRALGDQSKQIRNMVSDLQNNIITALLLVVGVIVVFMGWRPSVFVALSIPLSMLASMLVLEVLGFTLNMIVLFSLILALGMLVDNAIVVVENVYRHKEMGKGNVEAAVDGTEEVAVAVAASTATTVAAFLPLVFWTGIMGEFMGFLPKTVIIVLLMSLLVAVGILPVMMGRLLPERVEASTAQDGELRNAELNPVMDQYRSLLRTSIHSRYSTFGLGAAIFVATVGIYTVFNAGSEFFPETEPERAIVGVTLPQGSDVETTDQVVRAVELMLAQSPNVDTWAADVGVSAGGDQLQGASARPNEARITLDFLPDRNTAKAGEAQRVEPTSETVDKLRALVQDIPGAKITVEPQEMGPPVGKPINIEISGEDFDEVGELVLKLRRELENTVEGLADLDDNYGVGRPELRLRIDRGAAKRVGVSTAAVGNAVRTAIAGGVATTLREGEDEIDVVVQLGPEYRENLQRVLDLRLPGREDQSPDTFPVPLSAVASYELVGGSAGIAHIDQDMVITISGDVAEGFNENEVRANVQTFLDNYELPTGMATDLTGANEEQEQSMVFLSRAFLIAVALILLVLVTQFDSITMPAIILATVILSLIGVLWGLLLTGSPFSIIMTGIGVISLAGVVVNNAIVLLDYVQQLQARGLDTEDALVEAGLTRFRPVMLTAITTALGLFPMALGASFDFFELKFIIGSNSAAFWGPMAIAVIFGLLFATVLTLLMVPVLYSINEDLRDRLFPKQAAKAAAALIPLGLLPIALLAPVDAQALTLDEAWRAAEREDLSLAIAREDAIQTGTLRGQAWATLSPTIDVNATYVINNQEIALDFDGSEQTRQLGEALNPILEGIGEKPVFPTEDCGPGETAGDFCIEPVDPIIVQERTFWQGDLTVRQTIFSGAALPALLSANRLTAAAQADVRGAVLRSKANVARAFYGLLAAQQGVSVSTKALELAQGQLQLAQRRRDAGLTDRRALVSAELGVSQAERDLESSQEALVDAETSFSLLTGLTGEALEIPPPFVVPAEVDSALTTAQAQRPDLQAAKLRVSALKAERAAQDLRWMPRIDGVGSVNFTENVGFNNQNFTWRIALTASWSIWDGGFRVADRRNAASRMRSAQYAERLQERQAEREIRLAFEAHRRSQKALAAVEDEQTLADENLQLTERSYEAGSATWLELEQARLQVEATAFSLLQERTARDLAAIDLLVRTGTL
ncbi:MAG: efflux RND transporter permease subunit [Myxococcota bacterium]